MKKLLLIGWILLGFSLLGKAQEVFDNREALVFSSEAEKAIWSTGTADPFKLFRAVQANETETSEKWTQLIEDLDSKADKKGNELNFLRQIFQKTHQVLLKKYIQHSTFNIMLSEGKYDCVSGSAALGLLLERYGYAYDIVETDYHVFIVVNVKGKEIVLESTLPVGGMITTPSEVEKYLDAYKPEEFAQLKTLNQGLAGPDIDYSDNAIFRKVNLQQLAGLQYYNDAIVHFNSQAFGVAVEQLSKAYLLYPSDRILGLRELSVDLAYKTFGYDLKK
jgi:hypothetical protein